MFVRRALKFNHTVILQHGTHTDGIIGSTAASQVERLSTDTSRYASDALTLVFSIVSRRTTQHLAEILWLTRHSTDYGKAVEQRQRLDAQKSESEAVKKVSSEPGPAHKLRCSQLPGLTPISFPCAQEFASLSPENTIYKQVGPVLLKQDQDEAKANVDKRLEFINSEM